MIEMANSFNLIVILQNLILGGKRHEVETPILQICLRLNFAAFLDLERIISFRVKVC